MGMRGIASRGICVAGERAGPGAAPCRLPWARQQREPASACPTDLHQPWELCPRDLALPQSPRPRPEACVSAWRARQVWWRFLSTLSTCSFLCHPTLEEVCSQAWGQGSSPFKAPAPWCSPPWLLGAGTPQTWHNMHPLQIWGLNLYPSGHHQMAILLQLLPLPFSHGLVKKLGWLLCCQGETTAVVVCHFPLFPQFSDLLVFPHCGWSSMLRGSVLHKCLGHPAVPGRQQLPRYVLCLQALN